jgi:hypothetical protein
MKTILMIIGFSVGFIASYILGLYLIAWSGYIFQNEATVLAYTPRWIFYFVPLVLLGKTKRVKEVGDKTLNLIRDLLDFQAREERYRASLKWWDR